MESAAPSVFIIDDDPAVRIALGRLISAAGYPIRVFASARQFLDTREGLGPGCLLLDVRLPDVDGLELHRRLQDADLAVPVIFMTGFGDVPTSVRAMKSGAVDYLVKPVPEETLLGAIERALAQEAQARAVRVERQALAKRCQSLTPRETQVMRLVLVGRLNKQIARELGISEKTVKVHRGRVMQKIGVKGVAQLVQYANRLGLDAGTGEHERAVTVTVSSWQRSGNMMLSGVRSTSLDPAKPQATPRLGDA